MIEFVTNIYNSLIFLLIFMLFFPLYLLIGKKLNITYGRSTLLLLWHTFFSFVYFVYTFYFISDAKVYYIRSLSYDTFFYVGSVGIDYLISILRKNLELQYLTIFLLFSFSGALGLLFFDSLIKNLSKNSPDKVKKILSLIVLMPSINFWSSAIGKDSIAFLSVTIFLYSLTKLYNRNILFYTSLLLMFFIRPHISMFFLFSGFLYYLLSNKLFRLKSILNFLLISIGIFFLVPFSLQFAGVISISDFFKLDLQFFINKISLFTEHRQSLNLFGGSSVNIKEMNIFTKLFTYFFRPQFYEAHNIFSLVSSIDNFLLLLLFIFWIINIVFFIIVQKKIYLNIDLNLFISLVIYIFLTGLILSSTTANLGIAVRQKWMVFPVLIYLILVTSKVLYNDNRK